MRPPNMIHTILWVALPHRTPGHWAPPQLCQVIHVALDYPTTIHTRTLVGLPKTFIGVGPHHLQILLKPHPVTKYRRWPQLAEYRQLGGGKPTTLARQPCPTSSRHGSSGPVPANWEPEHEYCEHPYLAEYSFLPHPAD